MPLLNTTLISPNMLASIALFFPSACTIQTATATQDSHGQPIDSWADESGLVGIACRIAPASGDEVRNPEMTYQADMFTCVLKGNYPTIATTQRAVVDSVTYDVVDVGFDDEAIQTRLMLRRVV